VPFPNEHAARQNPPGKYVRFRRQRPNGWPAGLAAIYGITNAGKAEIQSIRAKATQWTVGEFREWLKDHGFKTSIEPAEKSGGSLDMESHFFVLDALADLFAANTDLDDDGLPSKIQILPGGKKIKARDGRVFSNPNPKAIVEAFNKDPVNLPIDVDHTTEFSGGPAHGWIDELQLGRGGSIWGIPQWNASGADLVKSRAYRYVSPAIFHDENGEVNRFSSIALVNRPALTMPALSSHQSEDSEKMSEKILAALGLANDATEDQALAAIDTIKNATPALDQYVPRSDYEKACAAAESAANELAEHRATEQEAAIIAAVDQATKDGKITPAQRDQAIELCRNAGLDAFASFVNAAPQIVEPTNLSEQRPQDINTGTHGLTPEELFVCEKLQHDPSDFAKEKGAA
jgi:phage I-like protein